MVARVTTKPISVFKAKQLMSIFIGENPWPETYTMHSIDNRNASIISSSDLAWAAGFLEGEGYIGSYMRKFKQNGYWYEYFTRQMRVYQSSDTGPPENLVRFKRIVAIGEVIGYKFSPKDTWKRKPAYMFYVTSDNVNKILRLLWPYLGEVKRKQAINSGFSQ